MATFIRRRLFSSSARTLRPQTDFTHIIIGAGVVGLAVARHLALSRPDTSTLVIERHAAVGTETSSRNSEVIHAGIYYPPKSLKTKLCIRGRELLYPFCDRAGVGYKKTGKWLVAQDDAQRARLEQIYAQGRELGVPLRWVGADERRREEPAVKALDDGGTLESPETGIVDSHALMAALVGGFEGSGNVVALRTAVVGIEPVRAGQGGWMLRIQAEGEAESTVSAEVVVNSAGLGAVGVHNMLPSRHREAFFAKGTYFSYSPTSQEAARVLGIRRLVYPVHPPGFPGLGTHLTLDLAGRIRFGPDVEWVSSPDDLDVRIKGTSQDTIDPRIKPATTEISTYLASIDPSALAPDYAGIRPKLGPAGSGFHDFVVERSREYEGWVDLLGIESPGLTSSLAIGERLDALLYGSV